MSRSLRIVFMGTPEFAVASLAAIHQSNHQVVGVVTVADKPAGRGQQVSMSAVKKYAVEHALPVLQPIKLKDPAFLEQLQHLQADLFVVVAFRMLPEVVWQMPPLGTINLHGSLLPQFRGAAPINHAIIQGEKQTGVTTFFLKHEIDTGHMIEQTVIPIEDHDTASTLHDKMMVIGALTLTHTIDMIADGTAVPKPQPETGEFKHAPKIFKETTEINWNQPLDVVHNFVRGLSAYPAAISKLHGKQVKIFMGEKHPGAAPEAGMVETDGKTYLRFAAADGWYYITDLQLEGKKRMQVVEFLRGWRP